MRMSRVKTAHIRPEGLRLAIKLILTYVPCLAVSGGRFHLKRAASGYEASPTSSKSNAADMINPIKTTTIARMVEV